MKKINQKIITSIFIFFIILLLSISIILANDVGNKENTEIDKEKIYYEIKYLDSKIIDMAKSLNNKEEDINWTKLLEETKVLYNYWNSVILDLNNLDINKIHLTSFGKNLDRLVLSIKKYDKTNTAIVLSELYNELTIYISKIEYNYYNLVMSAKYNLIVAFSIVPTNNWTLIHEHILNASNSIQKVVNSMKISPVSQYNINQAYIIIKEMENLINIKDVDVFNIKYKIALDKLENLSYQ